MTKPKTKPKKRTQRGPTPLTITASFSMTFCVADIIHDVAYDSDISDDEVTMDKIIGYICETHAEAMREEFFGESVLTDEHGQQIKHGSQLIKYTPRR